MWPVTRSPGGRLSPAPVGAGASIGAETLGSIADIRETPSLHGELVFLCLVVPLASPAWEQSLACGFIQSVWVPTPQVREWRALVAARRNRVQTKTMAKNRLHAILHRHHLETPETSQPFAPSQRAWWLALPVSPVEKLQVELDLDLVD